MHILALIIRLIGRFNIFLGHFFSWFSLACVLVCFTVVVMRYAFSMGYVWMQDLYIWLNAMMFMGMAGYVLFSNSHVRVDIFYRPAVRRRKAWVDLFGCIVFIIPFLAVLSIWSWPYIQRSWRILEGSSNYGGLPGLYILKSFILVFVFVVALQALAMILRSILVLAHKEDLLPERYRYQEDQ